MSDNYTDKQKLILLRSSEKKTVSNYEDAVDTDISSFRSWLTSVIDTHNYYAENYKPIPGSSSLDHPFANTIIPTGISNCTLTATSWINPKQPISRALTIIDNGNRYGYIQIPEEHVIPGDLVIATNPNNNHHHTMLITGFTNKQQNHNFNGKDYVLPEGHPLVRYSNGSTHPSGYRRSVGLLEYVDNSEGKTDIKYYRHYDPGTYEVLLPEITVTPQGNSFKDTTSIFISRNK